MPTKKTNTVPLMLRLPPQLHAWVVERAEVEGMSMNEYIVFILSDYSNLKNQVEQRLSSIETRLSLLDRQGDGA